MKFPLQWIREFVDLPGDEAQVADLFTFSGTEVEGAERVLGESVLEFGITVNRPDCMSVAGLAREAAALLGSPFRPAPSADFSKATKAGPINDLTSISVMAGDLCPRYVARVIRGVKIKDSPQWMQNRLIQCGLRPINAVVDITNFVLLEMGHPLHAFDLSSLKERRIIVRTAVKGEKIRTLDGVERLLDGEALAICDALRPVALAGIMGGEETGVTESTRDILIEAAVFDPVNIRRTSKRMGLHTDASHRFERGVDIDCPPLAADRCASLILEICGGELAEGAIDVRQGEEKPLEIALRLKKVNSLAGFDVPVGRCSEILARLGFAVESVDADNLLVRPPRFRVDVSREVDLVEEILRVDGLARVPSRLPQLVDIESGRPPELEAEESLRDLFCSEGFCENISMSFSDPALMEAYLPGVEPLLLRNPLSEQANALRTSIATSLLSSAASNRARGARSMALFEIGRVYLKGDGNLPKEEARAGLLMYSDSPQKRWAETHPAGLLDLKGCVAGALARLGAGVEFVQIVIPSFVDGTALEVRAGAKAIGRMGTVTPDLMEKFGFPGGFVNLAELFLKEIKDLESIPKFEAFSKYPSITRDYSFLLCKDVSWEALGGCLRGLGLEHLVSLDLVDYYDGKGVPEGFISWTFSTVYQSRERTLAEDDVTGNTLKIVAGLKEKFGAVQR